MTRFDPEDADFEFEDGDVFQGMGGDYWVITARLWNFDAREVAYADYYGPAYEITEDWHRREYVLAKLDPRSLGTEESSLNEHDLISHFQEATAEEARAHYREERPEDPLQHD